MGRMEAEPRRQCVPRRSLGTRCEARRGDLGPRSFTWAHRIALAVVSGSYGGGALQTVRAQAEPGHEERGKQLLVPNRIDRFGKQFNGAVYLFSAGCPANADPD